MSQEKTFSTIDEYIQLADENVQTILSNIRKTIHNSTPNAQECISYQMPAFKHRRIFIYFAAFKKHIGVYPPVMDDVELIRELAAYRNEKGNLSFSLQQPMPYELIAKVARALYLQYS